MYDRGQLHAQNVRFDLDKNVKSYKESVPFFIYFLPTSIILQFF